MRLALSNADNIQHFQSHLLHWYDEKGRVLPWRAAKDALPNPYHVFLSEFMLQQTQVATVIPYFHAFIQKWPDFERFAAAPLDEVMAHWAGLGYYARARNMARAADLVVKDHQGKLPTSLDALKALPGIGDYTAAAIAAIAYDQPAAVIDGNIARIITRLYNDHALLEENTQAIKARAQALTPDARAGDYAQAMMDLGAMICKPKNPLCGECPVQINCLAYQHQTQASLPKRKTKPPKPHRLGVGFGYLKHGQIWLDKRPKTGLLGGTYGLPTTKWIECAPQDKHKILSQQQRIQLYTKLGIDQASSIGNYHYCGIVTHIFTHFSLTLHLYRIEIEKSPFESETGGFYDQDHRKQLGISTLMQKAITLLLR
ncbi:MAG: A/G-specific adenine glycosylase [Alphaproteobacteria bacterium]